MSLWKIAWRSIQQRGFASLLTLFSMALGVMLVVMVLSIYGVIHKSFQNNSSLGYNMIVGPKGGSLQLTLNSVFYLSRPIEGIKYDYYLEFFPEEQRQREYKHSLGDRGLQIEQASAELQALAAASAAPGVSSLASLISANTLSKITYQQREIDRDGKYALFSELAIPLCLGDYFGRFLVVGTTPDFFNKLTFGPEGDEKFEFAQGRNFQTHGKEHGFFEAVVGANVAREKNVQLGDRISPAHGDPEGHGHEQKFTVVGILKPSGTPNDRAMFVNIEGFYLMEDHSKPIKQEEKEEDEEAGGNESENANPAELAAEDPHGHADGEFQPLPIEQREVTAILLKTSDPIMSIDLQNQINEGPDAQAVFPMGEIYRLFDVIVKPIESVLLALTGMVCFVSGISILVSIYNSMSDRRREIAVMRALGAGRRTVMSIILLESVFLSLGGGILGSLLGHGVIALASPTIEARTGVSIGFFDLEPKIDLFAHNGIISSELLMPIELMLVPALILLAVIVGFLPALSAYRTDVAKSLGS